MSGSGPIVLEMDTYRYHGHSMSDPGSTYRTRDEITGIRQERDPVERLRKLVVELDLLDPAEIKAIEKAQRKIVDDAVAAGKASPEPPTEPDAEHEPGHGERRDPRRGLADQDGALRRSAECLFDA